MLQYTFTFQSKKKSFMLIEQAHLKSAMLVTY